MLKKKFLCTYPACKTRLCVFLDASHNDSSKFCRSNPYMCDSISMPKIFFVCEFMSMGMLNLELEFFVFEN